MEMQKTHSAYEKRLKRAKTLTQIQLAYDLERYRREIDYTYREGKKIGMRHLLADKEPWDLANVRLHELYPTELYPDYRVFQLKE